MLIEFLHDFVITCFASGTPAAAMNEKQSKLLKLFRFRSKNIQTASGSNNIIQITGKKLFHSSTSTAALFVGFLKKFTQMSRPFTGAVIGKIKHLPGNEFFRNLRRMCHLMSDTPRICRHGMIYPRKFDVFKKFHVAPKTDIVGIANPFPHLKGFFLMFQHIAATADGVLRSHDVQFHSVKDNVP